MMIEKTAHMPGWNNMGWLLSQLAVVLFFCIAPNLSQAQALQFDKEASTVGVVFRQMSVDVEASFQKIDIKASFDPANVASSRAVVTIDMASFDFGPGAEEYNEEVRAPDWFDTQKFPTAQFSVTGARANGNNRFGVVGDLTIKGITQSITTEFELADRDGRVELSGSVPISRLAFNIGQGDWKDTSIVEDEVQVRFRMVASRPN
jgi:polyisoprenoid-binding protein YceI